MASDTQTRVQRTVRLDSDLDDQIQALARQEDRSLEAQMRRLLWLGLKADSLAGKLAADDAAAS
jgi:predicted transcriptional regulator